MIGQILNRLDRMPGALFLVALCLLASGLIRAGLIGTALAEELAQAAEPVPMAVDCPEPDPDILLTAIRDREDQLAAQELRLADRKQVLAVAEVQLADQIAALEQAEAKLATTLAIADQAAEKDLTRLTAVYENMKPKNAADIFATMDVGFAAGFLARMRPDAAAEIMSGLPTDRAYAISLDMAGRNAAVPTE